MTITKNLLLDFLLDAIPIFEGKIKEIKKQINIYSLTEKVIFLDVPLLIETLDMFSKFNIEIKEIWIGTRFQMGRKRTPGTLILSCRGTGPGSQIPLII